MRRWLQDLLVALSWANLSYLYVWSGLLTYTRADTYFMDRPPPAAAYAAACLDVLLLGGVLWVGITLARRISSGWAFVFIRVVLLLLCLVLLNTLRGVLRPYSPYLRGQVYQVFGTTGVGLLLCAGVLVLSFVLLRWSTRLLRTASRVLLILFPFVPMTLFQGIVAVTTQDPGTFAAASLAPPLDDAKLAPRVLWIIFDELDQRLVFDERPASIVLPELDRFRRQSVAAARAYSPSTTTFTSLPALITGRLVTRAQRGDASELLLTFADVPVPLPWRKVPGIFSRAREAGFNTALIGFFHPYCRVLHASLTSCWWYAHPTLLNSVRGPLGQAMFDQTRSLVETSTLSPFHQSLITLHHARNYRDFVEHAKQTVTQPAYGLTFLHVMIPHAPHFYDRVSGQPTLGNAPIGGYVDSLVLTDRTLGELRRALESAGLWDKTAILISSDHSYRAARALDGKLDRRVPFLLKLGGQKEGVSYAPPFNTIVTHDLLLAVLRGELTTPQEVVVWLDRCREACAEARRTPE